MWFIWLCVGVSGAGDFDLQSFEIEFIGSQFGRIAMPTHLLDEVSTGPASRFAHEKHEASLAAETEELAGLRFSIILTALWEASANVDVEHRNQLRSELAGLRCHYSQKIDEIAMTFGVQNAMKAQKEVEHTVAIPPGMKPLMTPTEDNHLYF
jgi:hypothetical protein